MEWFSIKDKVPEDGQKVVYFFKPVGTHIGFYERCKGEDALYGTHCFYSKSGFLTDEDVWWFPLPELPE